MNFNLFDDIDRVVFRKENNDFDNNPTNSQAFPANTPIGMAYVPFQQWGEVYEADEAFQNGTLFPELNYPFTRGGGNG